MYTRVLFLRSQVVLFHSRCPPICYCATLYPSFTPSLFSPRFVSVVRSRVIVIFALLARHDHLHSSFAFGSKMYSWSNYILGHSTLAIKIIVSIFFRQQWSTTMRHYRCSLLLVFQFQFRGFSLALAAHNEQIYRARCVTYRMRILKSRSYSAWTASTWRSVVSALQTDLKRVNKSDGTSFIILRQFYI